LSAFDHGCTGTGVKSDVGKVGAVSPPAPNLNVEYFLPQISVAKLRLLRMSFTTDISLKIGVPDFVPKIRNRATNGTARIGVGSFLFQIRRSHMIAQSGILRVTIMIERRIRQ
jgi:hypothetical protein